jgi:sugar lactone lactonase YvrE
LSIHTVAGNGRLGSRGDGGPAQDAELNRPFGLAIAQDGSIYFTEYFGNCVRRVAPDGSLVRVAGRLDEFGFAGDGGFAIDALFEGTSGIAIGLDGGIIVADDENLRVRRVLPDGVIMTIAGTGDIGDLGDGGPATSARFNTLAGLALGPDGSLYIADAGNARVRRIDPTGLITTVAGTGHSGATGDGGPATKAELYQPLSVAATPSGELFIADAGASRVRRVDGHGLIQTVAGNGERGSHGDGRPATEAQLNAPCGICVDRDGTLFISEFAGHRVRTVSPEGVITTVAGTGEQGYSGDGGPPQLAKLSRPREVALDQDGNLYIADSENNRVRKVV